jgi:hypothetical protein
VIIACHEKLWMRTLCLPIELKQQFSDIKVENLSEESTTLFAAAEIGLPAKFLLPSHQSGSDTDTSPQEKVTKYYRKIPFKIREKIKELYQIDLDFFQYTIDPMTLKMTY